ncbi:MAG: pectin acetylesterase-family hydrolase [Kofleriaceae bacterium]
MRSFYLSLVLLSLVACATPAEGELLVADPNPLAAPIPTIADALDCGTPASAGGLANALELQRVDVDTTAFPLAKCNDGTPATFFFRPGSTVDGRKRWVIQLQGGGGCRHPDACAQRWCSVGTNFGMTQMTSTLAPPDGTRGDGILERAAAFGSPMRTWNHVFLRYCSSDNWSGMSGPVVVDSHHPITGAAVQFQIEFNGRAILDAVVQLLRRDGSGPLTYVFGQGGDLPDLDTAETVVFAGASAGGGGVINNADYLGDVLRTHNLCQGQGCLEYRAIVDSTFGPSGETLDWTTSSVCAQQGLCTWEQIVASGNSMFTRHGDQSCATWHAANDPATAWQCGDADHAVRNHVTTPMLVRQGLVDQLLSGNSIDSGVSVPGQGAMTLALFAERVRDELLELGQLTSAEEAAAMSPPALYGPRCPKHETISNNVATYNVTVGNAVPRTMFDIFNNWRSGAAPNHAVHSAGGVIDCN